MKKTPKLAAVMILLASLAIPTIASAQAMFYPPSYSAPER